MNLLRIYKYLHFDESKKQNISFLKKT
jgi:hypothetical protein